MRVKSKSTSQTNKEKRKNYYESTKNRNPQQNEEKTKQQKDKDKERKRETRTLTVRKEDEKERDRKRKREKRQDEDHRQMNRFTIMELRASDDYREQEREKDRESKRQKRQDEEYREQEREKDRELKRQMRQDEEIREQEREKDRALKRQMRQDEEFREQERDSKREMREDEEYREQEREKDRESKREMREDEEYREQEREKDRESRREMREDEEYREQERKKDRALKRQMRQDEEFREQERDKDNRAKANDRTTNVLRCRQNFYNNLVRSNSNESKLKLQFMKDRSSTPEWVCCCCEGLFFKHSIIDLNRSCNRKRASQFVYTAIYNITSNYICKTCWKYVKNDKIPRLSTSNGLHFPHVPDCVKQLSALEERMVAPYINFMQIRPLKPCSLNPQLGMRGSVVNIPVEVNDMLQVLPRTFDDMATIQVKLKRHLLHKSHYMFEVIRQSNVLEALKYLITTPLYRKHRIEIDTKFMKLLNENDNDHKDEVDFVIDKEDMTDNMKEMCKDNGDDSDREWNDSDEMEGLTQLENVAKGDVEQLPEINDEVMLLNRNMQVTNGVNVIAPGQNKRPAAWHMIPDIDELCFPRIFCGQKCELQTSISYSDRVKSEVRRRDRRSCIPTRLLFMAKKKLELAALQNISICLRKTKRTKNVSARKVLDDKCVDEMLKFDDGYKILKQIRGSPAYWEARKKDLMATIRQLGKPTFFLTLSAGENMWPELIQLLVYLSQNTKITLEEALNLDVNTKTELVRNDPVSCARYFHYKANTFMHCMKKQNSIFGEYTVVDSFERVEFQARGSPHEHIFLWLDKAPTYDPEDAQSVTDCETFIDNFITCQLDDNDPYIAYQYHKHIKNYCFRSHKNKNENKCRFDFPKPVMDKTTILRPLPEEFQTKELKEVARRISNLMEDLYKNPRLLSFKDVLQYLEVDEKTYKDALRMTLQRPQVFLKRSSFEVGINGYNKDIIHLFESNMDLQFVIEEYGLASYIINYVTAKLMPVCPNF